MSIDIPSAVFELKKAEGINNITQEGELWSDNRPCDCCGTTLFGERANATGFHAESGEVRKYVCCRDCLHFEAYDEIRD